MAFDFLEEIEISEIGMLGVGEMAVGVVAVVAFDAVICEEGLDLIHGLDHTGLGDLVFDDRI